MIKRIVKYFKAKKDLLDEIGRLNNQIDAMRRHINEMNVEKEQLYKRLRISERLHDIAQNSYLKKY